MGKLKKKFSWSRITYLNFLWNFFTQLKIYIFPIYYRILNKKKLSIYFEKKIQPRCFDIREKFLFNNRYFKKKFYSKLRNMSGKLKKIFFMKPNNLFKFFVNFFYSIKNIYFPDILPHFKQKKTFYIFRKKNPASMLRYSRKIFVQQSLFKIFFYSKLRNMSGKLKKIFSWSRITYLNLLWNFFTQLKIYIFPIYYSILNKKKLSIYFEKKIQPRCFDIREKFLFNNRYFKKKFYSKLRNMSGKLKKIFFMKPNNLFKFFVNFFTQLKIYIFPIYYSILNKKKTFYIFRKKNPASMLRYSRKIFVQQSLFKIFYSKLRNMSGKLKKKFFMKPNNLFKFFVNFFTQLKIYIFPIYYSILNKKKSFYIFRKKNPASMLRYSRKNFVQ